MTNQSLERDESFGENHKLKFIWRSIVKVHLLFTAEWKISIGDKQCLYYGSLYDTVCLHMIQFSSLCAFRAYTLLNSCGFKGQQQTVDP